MHKTHSVSEGESHSLQFESSQSCLLNGIAWLSWEWSVQWQERGGSWLSSHVVPSEYLRMIHKRWKLILSF